MNLEGPRISLRPIADADLPAIEPWYHEAAALAYGQTAGRHTLQSEIEDARRGGAGGMLVISHAKGPTPLGLIGYRLGHPEAGWLTIGFIAMAAGQRGWGHGSEAVRLLETEAAKRGWAQRFRANVSAANGLGLYFWLRLGYRPAGQGAGRDTLEMVRTS